MNKCLPYWPHHQAEIIDNLMHSADRGEISDVKHVPLFHFRPIKFTVAETAGLGSGELCNWDHRIICQVLKYSTFPPLFQKATLLWVCVEKWSKLTLVNTSPIFLTWTVFRKDVGSYISSANAKRAGNPQLSSKVPGSKPRLLKVMR